MCTSLQFGSIFLQMSTSSVNGSTSDQLTYCNKNCPKCHKKVTIRIFETEWNKNILFYCCHYCGGFIGWCLPTNSQCRSEREVQMENMSIVTEQVWIMSEQLRIQSEQLQFQSAKMIKLETNINRSWCRICGLFILLVVGIVSVMKM